MGTKRERKKCLFVETNKQWKSNDDDDNDGNG